MNDHASVDQPVKTHVHPLCGDTGFRLEDIMRVMAYRDRSWERVKGILDDEHLQYKKTTINTVQPIRDGGTEWLDWHYLGIYDTIHALVAHR